MHQIIYFVHVSLLLLASFNAICFHWDVYVWTSASAGPNRAVYFGINVICGLPRVPADPLIWEFSSTRTILSRWAKGRHNRNDSVSFTPCVFVYTETCVVVTTCRSGQIHPKWKLCYLVFSHLCYFKPLWISVPNTRDEIWSVWLLVSIRWKWMVTRHCQSTKHLLIVFVRSSLYSTGTNEIVEAIAHKAIGWRHKISL